MEEQHADYDLLYRAQEIIGHAVNYDTDELGLKTIKIKNQNTSYSLVNFAGVQTLVRGSIYKNVCTLSAEHSNFLKT